METHRAGDAGDAGIVQVVAALAAFLVPFMGSALNLALPSIGSEMHLPAVVLNWVVGAYLVTSAALQLPFGRLGDLHGRRPIFVAGMLVHGAASIGCGLATSARVLIAFRLLQGAGGAMAFATGIAMLTSVFPPGERGRVLGINTAAVYVGLSAGPVLGGLLTQHLGWRSIFFVTALLSVAAAVCAYFAIRSEGRRAADASFDGLGATAYAVSLGAFMAGAFAFKTYPAARWLILAGAASFGAFTILQRRARSPLLSLALFRERAFALSNLAALIHYSATFAIGFLLSLYLQVGKGLSPQTAGLILLSQPVLMAALSPLAGRLSDRVEARRVASAGMALTALGLTLLIFLEPGTPLAVVVLDQALIGIGFGLFSSPNTNAVMSAVGRAQYGIASATLGTMRLVGQASSLAIVALLFSHFMGTARLGPESAALLFHASRVAFGLFAALCVAGVFASLARGTVHEART